MRRVEAFVAERREAATDATREEGTIHEKGDAQRQQEEVNDSTGDMDALMEEMTEAISQSEREAATAQTNAIGDAPEMQEMREAETTLAKEAKRKATAMRRASNFLQAMGSPGGE